MTDTLRVAHCSDIHLDGDHYHHDRYVNASDYYREMFDRVLQEMRGHDPDLMLLAGDLFDSNQARILRALSRGLGREVLERSLRT